MNVMSMAENLFVWMSCLVSATLFDIVKLLFVIKFIISSDGLSSLMQWSSHSLL